MNHPIIVAILLAPAVLLAVACAVAVLVMRDTYQRMQFSAPVTTVAVTLITIAVWVDDPQWQARIKAVLVAFTLFAMNAILTHATARAVRVKQLGRWEPLGQEVTPPVLPLATPSELAAEPGEAS